VPTSALPACHQLTRGRQSHSAPASRNSSYPRRDSTAVSRRDRSPRPRLTHALLVLLLAANGSFNGRGAERYESGAVYVGEYQDARRHGRGTMMNADGRLLLSFWKRNRPTGEGAQWTKSHRAAHRTHDGKEDTPISLREAGRISEQLGLPCPSGWAGRSERKEEVTAAAAARPSYPKASVANRQVELIARLRAKSKSTPVSIH
jgi:hypothetical protein